MKIILALLACLLTVTAAFAGANAGVSPYVRVADVAGGASKDAPYLEVRVGAAGFGGVNAVHVDLEYDATGLEFVDFTAGDLFTDPLVLGPFDRTDRHVVDVTTATLTGAVSASEGEVGVIRFRVKDESSSDVRIVSFQTADASWKVETQVSYENPVDLGSVPTVTRLVGNVPNPFNPVTEIRFELSQRTAVQLEVYNVNGQRVRTLVDESRSAGTQAVTWDGRDDNGSSVSSGVYFYRLRAGDFTESRRMTLIR